MDAENFIVVQGWMRTELNLKGNDLLVYSIIYGFSHAENQKFTGSLQYLADWCGCTKQGVLKNLKNLLNAGLIEKGELVVNGVNTVSYRATKFHGYETKFHGGMKLSFTNNIENNNIEIQKNTSKEVLQDPTTTSKEVGTGSTGDFLGSARKTVKGQSLYSKCVSMVDDFLREENLTDPALRNALIEYLKYRLAVKDKPLYANMWKGMLHKLPTISRNNRVLLQTVQFTLERGYLSFYPPNSGKFEGSRDKFSEGSGLRSDTYTQEELDDIIRQAKEREARGEQGVF